MTLAPCFRSGDRLARVGDTGSTLEPGWSIFTSFSGCLVRWQCRNSTDRDGKGLSLLTHATAAFPAPENRAGRLRWPADARTPKVSRKSPPQSVTLPFWQKAASANHAPHAVSYAPRTVVLYPCLDFASAPRQREWSSEFLCGRFWSCINILHEQQLLASRAPAPVLSGSLLSLFQQTAPTRWRDETTPVGVRQALSKRPHAQFLAVH